MASAASKPTAFETLEADFRRNPRAHAAEYARALSRAGRAEAAVAALRKLHEEAALDPPARLALACAAFDTFRVDDAEALLAELPGAWDEDAQAQALLAEIALEREDLATAKQRARAAFALDPKHARAREIMVFLGEISAADLSAEAMTGEASLTEEEDLRVPPRKQSFILRRVLVVALVLAALLAAVVAVYAWRVRVQTRIGALLNEAKPLKTKSDRVSLERAKGLYERALALDATQAGALSALAEIHALLFYEHGLEASKAELATWLERARGARRSERFLAEGIALVANGAAPRAQALLQETIAQGGVDGRVLFALGVAERALGHHDASRDAFRRAYALEPFQPTFAVELGDTFLIDSDAVNAESYWRKAAEANPEHDRALARAALGRLLLGDDPTLVQAKIEALSKRTLSTPHRAALLALQAQLADVQGGDGEHLRHEAQSLAPADNVITWLLARAGGKGALAAYDMLLARFPDLHELPVEAALFAARSSKDAAEKRLQAAKSLGAARLEAIRGEIALRAGEMSSAQTHAETALGLDPSEPQAHYVLARLLIAKKEPKKALVQLSKALEHRPSYPEVYEQVGLIYADNKEYERALESFAMAEKQYARSAASPSVVLRIKQTKERARAHTRAF